MIKDWSVKTDPNLFSYITDCPYETDVMSCRFLGETKDVMAYPERVAQPQGILRHQQIHPQTCPGKDFSYYASFMSTLFLC